MISPQTDNPPACPPEPVPVHQSPINAKQEARSRTADILHRDSGSLSSVAPDTAVHFLMSTPVVLGASAGARIAPTPPIVILPPFAACRVAVIDDEGANCRICKRYLTQLGVPNDNIIVLPDGTNLFGV